MDVVIVDLDAGGVLEPQAVFAERVDRKRDLAIDERPPCFAS
jgi:hypothetical protein